MSNPLNEFDRDHLDREKIVRIFELHWYLYRLLPKVIYPRSNHRLKSTSRKKKTFDELMKKKKLSSSNFPCGHLTQTPRRKRMLVSTTHTHTHTLALSFGKRSNRIPRSNYRHVWQIVHEFHWTRRVYNYYHQVTRNSDQYHLMSQKRLIVHPDTWCSVIEQLQAKKTIQVVWRKSMSRRSITFRIFFTMNFIVINEEIWTHGEGLIG